MADVLIYWRDYAGNRAASVGAGSAWRNDGGVLFWHSSAKCMGELLPGDRMWMVTSGKGLRRDPEQAAFLVAVWVVRDVNANPGDDPAYPAEAYRTRVVADPSASVTLTEPIPVDDVLRPEGRDRAMSIGRFLQGPRVLSDEKRRRLRAVAGGELAAEWLRAKG